MGSNRPKPFSALGHISTPIRPSEETGTRAKPPSPPPPKPRGSRLHMAPAMVFTPERPIDRIATQIESRRASINPKPPTKANYSTEYEEEKTPVRNPYEVVDGKVVNMGGALPSAPPIAVEPSPTIPETSATRLVPTEESPPTIPETPVAILAKISLPPRPVLNPVWIEDRGTRIRNSIMFFLLACFVIAGIAGATWAFLWNGRNHQELIDHQREEQEKQEKYR